MNRADLRARLRTLSGVLMDTLMSDGEADAFLNAAYLSLCGVAEWAFLYVEEDATASAGTNPLPGGIGRVQDVLLADGGDRRLLQRRSTHELARYPAHRDDGAPWAWAAVGDDGFRLFPGPQESTPVEVRGWIDPTPLEDDTAEPEFSPQFHDVVAYEAAALVLESEGDDSGRSERYRGEVQGYLDRMARRYLPDGGQVAYPPLEVRLSDEPGRPEVEDAE